MNIFAVLSFISSLLFLQAGIYSLIKDRKSPVNKVFALLSFLFAIYAFSYALFFNAETLEQVYLYDKIASVGWVFFPVVTVLFFYLLTRNMARRIFAIIFSALLLFAFYSFYVAIVDLESVKFFYQYEDNWYYTPYDTTISYYLFVFYLIASVLVVYYMLIGWYFMADSNREKYQAKILLFHLSFFFILSFFSNLVFPYIETHFVPALAPINALVLIGSGVYVLFFLPSASITPEMVYHLIVNHVKEFLLIADKAGKIYATNQYTLSNLKYNSYELNRCDLSDIFSEPEKVKEILQYMNSKNVSRQIRLSLLTRDKEKVPVVLYIIKIEDAFKRNLGYVFSCMDYRQKLKLKEEVAERVRAEKNLSQIRKELELLVRKRTQELQEANLKLQQEVVERRSAEEQIKNDLQEKIKLVQEVHHRVKNNIQMIISLVNMLCSHPKVDSQASETLRDIAEKIRYISHIHEDFYSSPNLSNIAFSSFLKKAIGELYRNFGQQRDIIFKLNLTDENLDISHAIPLGIIFNELLMNSLHYAFPTRENSTVKSTINVEFFRNNGEFSLVVSDNGVGLPLPFHELKSQKIGLQLVNVLTKDHLKGKISHFGQQGTTFIVKFEQ
ncbi:MAG: histidine kinase dimerization/phosphoacceptor domain -containing protein [Bacteroidota bacterium]